jgi:hypothetical protein
VLRRECLNSLGPTGAVAGAPVWSLCDPVVAGASPDVPSSHARHEPVAHAEGRSGGEGARWHATFGRFCPSTLCIHPRPTKRTHTQSPTTPTGIGVNGERPVSEVDHVLACGTLRRGTVGRRDVSRGAPQVPSPSTRAVAPPTPDATSRQHGTPRRASEPRGVAHTSRRTRDVPSVPTARFVRNAAARPAGSDREPKTSGRLTPCASHADDNRRRARRKAVCGGHRVNAGTDPTRRIRARGPTPSSYSSGLAPPATPRTPAPPPPHDVTLKAPRNASHPTQTTSPCDPAHTPTPHLRQATSHTKRPAPRPSAARAVLTPRTREDEHALPARAHSSPQAADAPRPPPREPRLNPVTSSRA